MSEKFTVRTSPLAAARSVASAAATAAYQRARELLLAAHEAEGEATGPRYRAAAAACDAYEEITGYRMV